MREHALMVRLLLRRNNYDNLMTCVAILPFLRRFSRPMALWARLAMRIGRVQLGDRYDEDGARNRRNFRSDAGIAGVGPGRPPSPCHGG
jgi:hypothetical protein